MRIWLINHYAVPPRFYPLIRPSQFAKNLIKNGHEVTIIAASTAHNSDINLIEGKEKIKKIEDDGIPYVLINCPRYKGNGLGRVINILSFARKLPKVLDLLEKPDVVLATSFDPLTCFMGVKYAKKHGIKAIAEIADLWPETLIAYNGVSRHNPVVKFLRKIEKMIYTEANAIVFTMEGAYDYIIAQNWEKLIPRSKVYYINNGIDIDQFERNKRFYQMEDVDLENTEITKVVYAGSIKKANNIGYLLDVAEKIKSRKIVFLIWGDGEELNILKDRKERERLENVHFKGRVKKQYIPYIISHSDINFLDPFDKNVAKYGISSNKLFEYIRAGKPILMNDIGKYNPIKGHCLFTYDDSAETTAMKIEKMALFDENQKKRIANELEEISLNYSFESLTKNLEICINSVMHG